MSKITINGVDYHYQAKITDPSQPVFVMLHGFLGSKHDFDKSIKDFSGQYLTIDLLGFADNRQQSIEPSRFSQSQQIADLSQIFTALSLKNIYLCGYSMGGRIAIAFALKYPQMIKHLILESTTAGIADKERRLQRQIHDHRLADKVLQVGMDDFIHDWENMPLFASQKNTSETDFAFMHQQRIDQDPTNVANSLREMGTGQQPNHWDELDTLNDLPVDIIAGEKDQKFVKIGHLLQQKIPSAKLSIVSGVGHNIHFEAPKYFADFLMKLV